METNNFVPYGATHPTELVKNELKARGISNKEFAERMGMKASNMSRFLKGETITSAIAIKLEQALDIPAEFWLNLQAQYERDLMAINDRDEKENEAIKIEGMLSTILNLNVLFTRLRINTSLFVQEKLRMFSDIIGTSPLDFIKQPFLQQVCYKKSDASKTDEINQNTWLSLVYIQALQAKTESVYKTGDARSAAEEIAQDAHKGNITENDIREILGKHGIAYIYVEKLKETPIDAVSMFVNGVPTIGVTHRHNNMSRLIFDVLHELGHFALHFDGNTNKVFISTEATEWNKTEDEANTFAENILIAKSLWDEMMNTSSKIGGKDIVRNLKKLSLQNNLDSDIVLWRYMHETHRYNLIGVNRAHIR